MAKGTVLAGTDYHIFGGGKHGAAAIQRTRSNRSCRWGPAIEKLVEKLGWIPLPITQAARSGRSPSTHFNNATYHSVVGQTIRDRFSLTSHHHGAIFLVCFFATNEPIMDSPIQLGLNATSHTPPYTPPSSVHSEEHPYNVLSPPRLSTVDFVLAIRLVVLC